MSKLMVALREMVIFARERDGDETMCKFIERHIERCRKRRRSPACERCNRRSKSCVESWKDLSNEGLVRDARSGPRVAC